MHRSPGQILFTCRIMRLYQKAGASNVHAGVKIGHAPNSRFRRVGPTPPKIHSHVYEADDNRLEVPRGHVAMLVSRVDGVGEHLRIPEHPAMMRLTFRAAPRGRLWVPFRCFSRFEKNDGKRKGLRERDQPRSE